MEQKYTGIVLRTVKYNDTSVIADLYTAESGRISLLASIPRSGKSLVRTSLFQPLAILEVETSTRSAGMLSRIREARVALPLLDLPFHPHKSARGLLCAISFIESISPVSISPIPTLLIFHFLPFFSNCRISFIQKFAVFSESILLVYIIPKPVSSDVLSFPIP